MALFRLYATKDTWITDTLIPGDQNPTNANQSNLGANPTLQAYKVTSSFPSLPPELARILVNFDIGFLSQSIASQLIPSASVSYFLNLTDYPLKDTVPTSFDMFVYPVSASWDEGVGADYLAFSDLGWANWLSGTSVSPWQNAGGDFVSGSLSASMHFDTGTENLVVDVTSIVSSWLSGTLAPNGFMVKLGNTEETNGNDYYRKAFYSRQTTYAANVPFLEARWNDVRKDNRKNFAFNQSSSLYFYNLIRGIPQDLSAAPLVRLQDHVVGNSASFIGTFQSVHVATGIYAANFWITNTASFSSSWVDIWLSGNQTYVTGTFSPLVLTGTTYDSYPTFVADVSNLKRIYRSDELARITVNVRPRNYNTFVLPIASGSLESQKMFMENMFFSVLDNNTGDVIIPFSTGSVAYSQLGYNANGNFFNLWMNSFVPGFTYRLLFLIEFNAFEKTIIDDDIIFKVI